MNDDLMRQVGTLQTTVDDIKKPEISRNVITPFASLPGLIGLWYGGNYQRSTGDMPNLAPYISGASSQDLSYNGNPNFDYLSNGVGYVDLDGTGDYFSVADNTDLDILGTESFVANPGMTMGGWFQASSLTARMSPMGKGNGTVNSSYYINWRGDLANDPLQFYIFDAVGNPYNVTITNLPDQEWYLIVARYIPSTELKLFANTQKNTNIVGIPAALNNGNVAFNIGGYTGGAFPFNGYMSISFLCSSALNDATIQSLFQQTRSLYGV